MKNQRKQGKSATAIAAARSFVLVLALLPSTLYAQPEIEIEYIGSFGSQGSAPGQFGILRGITVSNNGEIIVADAENERIQVCDLNGQCFAFGEHGSLAGSFNNPHGVAVDSADRIVTVETGNSRIQIFSATGEYIQTFGSQGTGLGQFRIPGGVWVDHLDRILVADENNDRVQICSNIGQCTAFGSTGSAAGQFLTPRAVAVDEAGLILVSERDNHRISICEETGDCTFFGGTSPGSEVGKFHRPRELIPDGWGNIIVADGDNHRLQVCNYEGDCLAFGEFGSGPGQFRFPIGVAMDQQSRLYVADQENHRVQVFQYSAGFKINAGLTDAWYNSATSGQGFFITAWPASKRMFVAWFTYDTERPPEDVTAFVGEPGHRWMTAQGGYSGDTANLTIYVSKGGTFDSAEPPVTRNPDGDGTMIIEFADCTQALVTYELPAMGLEGQIPITRIVEENVPFCEMLAE